jgi:hypothetical protein
VVGGVVVGGVVVGGVVVVGVGFGLVVVATGLGWTVVVGACVFDVVATVRVFFEAGFEVATLSTTRATNAAVTTIFVGIFQPLIHMRASPTGKNTISATTMTHVRRYQSCDCSFAGWG